MKWLKLLLELIPVIGNILAIVGKKKIVKKLKDTEEVLSITMGAVEEVSKTVGSEEKGKAIKKAVAKIAKNTGLTDKVNSWVRKAEDRIYKRFF